LQQLLLWQWGVKLYSLTHSARRHNVNMLLSNSTFLFLPFLLCDVGRVAVNNCFKLLSFFTFIFAVLLLNLIILPSPGTVTAHATCHVTDHRGQKWSTFLKSLNPIYLFTLSLVRCYEKF